MGHQTSSDPNVFILPDLGEGVHEAELIAWKVAVGEEVKEHQTLAEMETDKALVEVPSPRAGVIKQLHGSEGEILNVGNPLVTYEGGADAPSTSAPAPETAQAEEKDAGTVVGSVSDEPLIQQASGGKALAAPAVRKLAKDLGVDINTVVGTGLAGRVTDKDVRAAASGGGAAPAAPSRVTPSVPAPSSNGSAARTSAPPTRAMVDPPKPGETQKIPFRGVRRKIAERLSQSMQTAVHFTVMDEADVSTLDRMRKDLASASGERVSFLPFVVAAVNRSLKKFPSLNALVDDENQEIVRHSSIHIGLAVDTEHGLTVPVIPDADALGVLQLGRIIGELAGSARDRSIPREQLMGSTFTVSNVGSYAGRFATPVINYPEVAILAAGRVREGVVVRNGGMHIAKLMPLSLACDHRVVDGVEGALFLADVIEQLQSPEGLMAPARR
ncbi:MAG: dihydrolipoamide acetyltransferase family protein [Phycisphaerales bacterium JB043]